MSYSSLKVREAFHLFFLRHSARRLSQRNWALKGGICLRFFHNSPRISEDIDFDVGNISKETLGKAVDQILTQRPLLSDLSEFGVQSIKFTKPKQTGTSQRWNAHIDWSGGQDIVTRVECSRRTTQDKESSGIPDERILSEFHCINFIARYYSKERMIVQKLNALSSSHRSAARDLFDIDYLFSITDEKNRLAFSGIMLENAMRQIKSFTIEDFRREVCPFLPEDLSEHYREKEHFLFLKDRVIEKVRKISAEGNQP